MAEETSSAINLRIDALKSSSNYKQLNDELKEAFGQIGLYLPHLSLRYLFQMECLLLERFLLITGFPGVNKSSFMYWIYKLFRDNNGNYLHFHLEDKDTPTLRMSILKYDSGAGWTENLTTLDQLFTHYKEKIDWIENEVYPKYNALNKLPLVIGIDSLTAKLAEETIKKIEINGGVPDRRHSFEAALLTDWFRVATTKLRNKPYFLVAINHEKPRVTPNGLPTSHIPGGIAQNFYATYRVHLEKEKSLQQTASGWEGNVIRLKMTKSSTGTTNVSISAEIIWKVYKEQTKSGRPITLQKTIWNWPKASCELLVDMSKGSSPAAKFIRDKMRFEKSMGKYKAPGIGIDKFLNPIDFSRLLESNHEVLTELEPLLGIRKAVSFKPGYDYEQQKQAAIENLAEDLEVLFEEKIKSGGKDIDEE